MRLCALLWSLALTSRAQSVFCTTQGAQGRAVLSLLCPWTTWGGSSCSPLPWSVHLDFFPLSDGRCSCYFVNVIFSLCCWVGWLWTGECYHLPPPAGVCHLFVLILLQHCASKKKKVCISWNCWHSGVVTNVTSLHPKYMNQIFGYNFPTLIAIDTFWFESPV